MNRRRFLGNTMILAAGIGLAPHSFIFGAKGYKLRFDRDIYLPYEVLTCELGKIIYHDTNLSLKTTHDIWFLTEEHAAKKGVKYDFTMEDLKQMRLKDMVAFCKKDETWP